HELCEDNLIEELGDVLWYITYLSKVIGVDLETIANRNIEKLRKRYPEGWDPNRSIHREK
ncbi:nucleotide pyrophosphohydrolase, partial [Clostridium botulinum]|nr:nucleotide pyrophosphohydrolase [Clostridium botulinum]